MKSSRVINFRSGYTTGTCAQAATKGACTMLANQAVVNSVEVETPSGVKLKINLIDQKIDKDSAKCGVIKDAGDDPDVTNGAKIYAQVKITDKRGVQIKGAQGVGKITQPGLCLRVGEWAINPIPRKMILQEASKLLTEDKGLEVTISVPDGEALAQRTYNPKLGIVGGISIIGTTGIVEPRSLDAYKTSLALELAVLKARGYHRVVLVLGYVGEKFCQETLKLNVESIIKIGDHIGFMLQQCAKKKIKEVILIGHIGKLIKIANNQFNTHSKFGDHRVDSIARYAKAYGLEDKSVDDILKQTTAEATIEILRASGLMKVFDKIAQDVSQKAEEFINNKIWVDCIILSLKGEVLGESIHHRHRPGNKGLPASDSQKRNRKS